MVLLAMDQLLQLIPKQNQSQQHSRTFQRRLNHCPAYLLDFPANFSGKKERIALYHPLVFSKSLDLVLVLATFFCIVIKTSRN